MVWGKKSKYSKFKNNQPGGTGVWCWCCNHILCATALHFVLRQCFLCHGIVLHAAASLFMLWPFSVCRSIVLCAMVLCYVLQRCSCAAAMLFMPQQSGGLRGLLCVVASNNVPQHCIVFCAVSSLCLSKKDLLQHVVLFHGMSRCAAALFFVLQPSSLCCSCISFCHSKKWHAKVLHSVDLHFASRKDVLLHSMDSTSCHGMVHRAVEFCCHTTPRIWGRTNNLCGILARIRQKQSTSQKNKKNNQPPASSQIKKKKKTKRISQGGRKRKTKLTFLTVKRQTSNGSGGSKKVATTNLCKHLKETKYANLLGRNKTKKKRNLWQDGLRNGWSQKNKK